MSLSTDGSHIYRKLCLSLIILYTSYLVLLSVRMILIPNRKQGLVLPLSVYFALRPSFTLLLDQICLSIIVNGILLNYQEVCIQLGHTYQLNYVGIYNITTEVWPFIWFKLRYVVYSELSFRNFCLKYHEIILSMLTLHANQNL